MLRDIGQLTARPFDLLVVGGGVYGLIVAYDAAQRGLSVALIEARDFGSASSFNHHRTIHGGLRYLQTLDIARARESILERRSFARVAPSAVRAVPFVLPLQASLMRGKLAMRAGFLVDRYVGRDRNLDIPASLRLPPGEVLGRDAAVERFPALAGIPLEGVAVWHDYVTTDADRLTLAWGLAAAAYGAVLANYVEATALTIEGGRATGVTATDTVGNHRLDIRARVVVNATGASIDRLLSPAAIATGLPMLKAMNFVTRLDALPHALGGRARSGRNLFMVPWKGRALFGTWESAQRSDPDDRRPHSSDIDSFLEDVNQAFPSAALTRQDITLVHRGVVPAAVRRDGRVSLEGHDQVHDHARRGIEGLISVAGTKYTTARAVAERVTDRVVSKLGRAVSACRTATTPLPLPTLVGHALMAHAVKEEMVVTLEDAVVRRTPLGALGYPGDEAIAHAAGIVGTALGWTEEKQKRESEALRRFYD